MRSLPPIPRLRRDLLPSPRVSRDCTTHAPGLSKKGSEQVLPAPILSQNFRPGSWSRAPPQPRGPGGGLCAGAVPNAIAAPLHLTKGGRDNRARASQRELTRQREGCEREAVRRFASRPALLPPATREAHSSAGAESPSRPPAPDSARRQNLTTRAIVQYAATAPIAYAGSLQAQGARSRPSRRRAATTPTARPTNASCPTSTPTLKNSSASGIACSGSPSCASAPAKPSPCSSPNANAASHGYSAARLRRP